MAESRAFADLIGALVRLRQVLHAVPLGLSGGQVPRARERRTQIVALLEDYVLPRLLQVEAPLLGVVGGPTGSGKSTLVNSLVRRTVSAAGPTLPGRPSRSTSRVPGLTGCSRARVRSGLTTRRRAPTVSRSR